MDLQIHSLGCDSSKCGDGMNRTREVPKNETKFCFAIIIDERAREDPNIRLMRF